MIEFKEGQQKIYIRKHKLTLSSFPGCIDFNIVCDPSEKSGYGDNKFVRVVSFENVYDIETIRNCVVDGFESSIPGIMYWENGGYVYDKKTF